MSGRKLYDRYSYEMADQDVEIDEWEDPSDADRRAWDALAEWVVSKGPFSL